MKPKTKQNSLLPTQCGDDQRGGEGKGEIGEGGGTDGDGRRPDGWTTHTVTGDAHGIVHLEAVSLY